jgi:Mn2+/Fe2+ NRAMP family transporter
MTTNLERGGSIEPPNGFAASLAYIGPGVIIAGSIVGSGELIGTTTTGAQAGFSLLWLILIGCVIKVFVQVELGRYAIVSGKTTLSALNEVPGPRSARRGNWLIWVWCIMWLALIGQLGGVVYGVGESLALSIPITQQGSDYNQIADALTRQRTAAVSDASSATGPIAVSLQTQIDAYRAQFGDDQAQRKPDPYHLKTPLDAWYWTLLTTLLTCVLLIVGRYGLVQWGTTILVGVFTLLTIVTFVMMQFQSQWRVESADWWEGLRFRLPPGKDSRESIATALATFGIIGVGGTELVFYPYWCVEKGYAQWAGSNDGSRSWSQRALGWMRVMRIDAWLAMLLYTSSTVAFYLLGAAVLHRKGLNPASDEMIRSLAVMYEPVFGTSAAMLLLIGAFAVLYSTFFVATASHARVAVDALRVLELIPDTPRARKLSLQGFIVAIPLISLVAYMMVGNATQLVFISGTLQSIMLPMLAFAALWFRYRRTPVALRPGKRWDVCLWVSSAVLLVAGLATLWFKLAVYF